jgi:Flp pilus assembly protein TadG
VRAAGSEQGQVAALMIFCLISLLGLSALVIDAGVWFQAKRGLQAQVDAAALAGAQGLPDTATATALATQYAQSNGFAGTPTITFPSPDSIEVTETKPMEGIFSRVLGVLSVDVGAHAVAAVKPLMTAKQAVPIAVSTAHPDLSCGVSCFGQPATIKVGPPYELKPDKSDDKHDFCDGDCEDDGDQGYATLISLSGKNKKVATLAALIQNGYGKDMALGNYKALKPKHYHVDDKGKADKNTQLMLNALDSRLDGAEMTLPIYQATYKKQDGDKDDTQEVKPKKDLYPVVGWVGFKLGGIEFDHDKLFLHGVFTRLYRNGPEGDSGQPDYSAASIDLTS